jgi:hypothetical protein
MNLSNIIKLLPFFLLLTSCAKIEGNLNANVYEAIKCSVFEVFNDKNPLGTGFFLEHEKNVIAITASHSLLSSNKPKLSIRSACSQESLPIKSFALLGGLDAAVLYPEKTELVKGISIKEKNNLLATPVYGIAFPNLQNAEPRFKGLPIPTTGLLVDNSNPDILFSMDIVHLGSSGSPVVDVSGHLLGMLTNRVMIDGNYAGVCYGISAKTLQSALSHHTTRPLK